MKKSLLEAKPFAEAFERLLHPFAEVVIHDLENDQIAAIFNPLSRREVGDPSYLERMDLAEKETVIGPYEKTNWDGRTMKSISVVLRNEKEEAEGFLCVNIDVSHFEAANQVIKMFMTNHRQMSGEMEELFKDDQYEKLNLFVQNYCRRHQVSVEALSRTEKKEIILTLSKEGGVQGKNAANYVGRVLGVSRATVYNYLKEVKS